MDVFFTVDVEIWCSGWEDIDRKFPEAFQRYVYGTTKGGDFGLPYTIERLNEYGLNGVFFVEPLFATRFGLQPLQDIVGLLNDGEQEVQLHLHTEWVDESKEPLLPDVSAKRQYLRQFSVSEQQTLIEAGIDLLERAGASPVNAFRAGSFGFNQDTLTALGGTQIRFDSSYNETCWGDRSGVLPGIVKVEPFRWGDVCEYPMTVFDDGTGKLRHVQLTACSFSEIEGLLWRALEAGRQSFVILSHNFELLNPAKTRADQTVVKRFEKLCRFLDANRGSFNLRGFHDLECVSLEQPEPLKSPLWKTGARMMEQLARRRYE